MDILEIILQSRMVHRNIRHPKNVGQLVKYFSGTLRCFENLWSRIELAAKTNGVSYILDKKFKSWEGWSKIQESTRAQISFPDFYLIIHHIQDLNRMR